MRLPQVLPWLVPLCWLARPARAAPEARVDLVGHAEFPKGVDSGPLIDALERRAGAMRSCYQMGLETQPTLKGDLTVSLTRKPDGATGATLLTSDLKAPEIEQCLLDALTAIRFAAPAGGATFEPLEFTFRFSVVQAAAPPDLNPFVQACYDAERRKDPRMEGRIQVHLMVKGDGKVGDVTVQPTVPAVAGLASCVQDRLSAQTFAPDGSGQDVSWNLAFNVAPAQ